MKAWEIVGYTYQADTYCPDHIVAQVTANPGDVHHRSAVIGDPERHLDFLALLAYVDRGNEDSYDSDEFPKVIFASQVEDDTDRCAIDGQPLIP